MSETSASSTHVKQQQRSRISIEQVLSGLSTLIDKDRMMQLHGLHGRVKRAEISSADFFKSLKVIVGVADMDHLKQIISRDPNIMPRSNPQDLPPAMQIARFGLNQPRDYQVSSAIQQQQNRNLGLQVGHGAQQRNFGVPNQSAVHQQQHMASAVQNRNVGYPVGHTNQHMQNRNVVGQTSQHMQNRNVGGLTVQHQHMPNRNVGYPAGQTIQSGVQQQHMPNRNVGYPVRQTNQSGVQQQHMASALQNRNVVHPIGQKKQQDSSFTPNQSTTQQQNTQSAVQKKKVGHPVAGQKKQLDDPVSSLAPSRKKQKVSDDLPVQSIKQLIDVTAAGGVDVHEEEEMMLSSRNGDTSSLAEASRIAQEEEERLILEKIPLQKKLKEIVSKCGLNGVGKDVEKCLSLAVEERLRGLVVNLIRLSKQRADTEKFKHRTEVTSDVRNQLMLINKKAQQQQQQEAQVEKVQEQVQNEGNSEEAKEALKRKQEGAAKANAAVRAAAGGSVDMLARWKLMAEKAKQNPPVEKTNTLKGCVENQKKEEKTSNPTQGEAKRDQGLDAQAAAGERKISIKDVIAALERDHLMSKSPLIHKFFELIP